jgi:competence protein ComEA
MNLFRHARISRALLIGVALLTATFAAETKKESAPRGAPTTEKSKATSPGAKTSSTREKIDINTADVATLASLPGIGPEIAQRIVAARPFKSIDDLDRVKGIGPERLEQIRGEVTASVRIPPSKNKLGEPSLAPTGRGSGVSGRESSSTTSKLINVNTASAEELEVLPGIGPVKAAAIVEARQERPFKSKEDLMRVKGIKEATLNDIKDLITVR